MWLDVLLIALVLLVGIVGSGLYSGAETGVYTINRVRLRLRAEQGEPRAGRLRREINNPSRMLIMLLIGTNLMTYIASFAFASLVSLVDGSEWVLVLATAFVLTPILFVFAETLPKDLFRAHTDRWTYRLTGGLIWSRRLFTVVGLLPVVLIVSRLLSRLVGGDIGATSLPAQRREMAALLKEGVTSGILTERQTALLDRALAVRDLTVATEMTPWPRVIRLPESASCGDLIALNRRDAFTRLALVDAAGRVIGVVNMLDALLHPGEPAREYLRPIARVGPKATLQHVLDEMYAAGASMAIVERAGLPVGVVTMKDLVEPLIGELRAW